MPTTFDSTRFGTVNIPSEAVIEFPNGLIGLGGSRYALVTDDADSAFLWLHSIDDPELAIPLTSPWRFFADFALELSDDDVRRAAIASPEEATVYVTVRAAEALEDFTANLRAPIVIAHGRGFQVINQVEQAPVRAPLFASAPDGAERAA